MHHEVCDGAKNPEPEGWGIFAPHRGSNGFAFSPQFISEVIGILTVLDNTILSENAIGRSAKLVFVVTARRLRVTP